MTGKSAMSVTGSTDDILDLAKHLAQYASENELNINVDVALGQVPDPDQADAPAAEAPAEEPASPEPGTNMRVELTLEGDGTKVFDLVTDIRRRATKHNIQMAVDGQQVTAGTPSDRFSDFQARTDEIISGLKDRITRDIDAALNSGDGSPELSQLAEEFDKFTKEAAERARELWKHFFGDH